MNIIEIKAAVDSGKDVNWSNKAYRVIKDRCGQYLIHCLLNDHYIGLHGNGKFAEVLNGSESDFFINQ